MTDADYRLILSGYKGWQDRKVAKATAVAHEQRFFHWFIEFPEVFSEGGFDCILGNPPYLGGSKISSLYSYSFSNFLVSIYPEARGLADLISFFIKRSVATTKNNGFFSLITTDTISQGITREAALEYICEMGKIVFAVKSIKWPGVANVSVSLFSFYKGTWKDACYLENKAVDYIGSFLDISDNTFPPFTLDVNKNKIYSGSKLYGEGFVLEHNEYCYYNNLPNHNTIIKAYLVGDDLVNSFDYTPKRWVIDVNRYEISEIENQYPEIHKHIETKIKPERFRIKENNTAKKYYWRYTGQREELYEAISGHSSVIVFAKVAKYVTPVILPNEFIFSDKVIVLVEESPVFFSIIQSSLYNEWVRKYSTKMGVGGGVIQYSISSCFSNFPIPNQFENRNSLLINAEIYCKFRGSLQVNIKLGLTELYNLFHSNAITAQGVNENDKQVASQQKHLEKTVNTISFDEAIFGILKLRELHVQMDEAVLDAYGWNDIALRHDFYEVDYLPENDRVRFTIHPDARKEVLKRLLELNHKIHEEEVKAGLWEKKKTVSKKTNVVNEPQAGYGCDLFNQE